MAGSTRKIAQTILSREGVGAVWELHLDAAVLYRDGCPKLAKMMVEIADAIEEMILSRQDRSAG
jgi:hypothetical protein